MTQVDTADYSTTPPTHITRDLFDGRHTLAQAITATHANSLSGNALPVLEENHTLFAAYIQDDNAVEPKPFAEDMKDEVSYRNWLSRNLTALTKNYIAHRLSSYLSDNHVTQAINDTITGYTTNYEQTQLNGVTNMAANTQIAASRLRSQRPR